MTRVLVLGGTGEGRKLAATLADRGVPVTYSLAGRIPEPLTPPGDVRVGGFGGAAGLARWLVEHDVRAVVDATHPFARDISVSAARACARASVELTRLERPGWRERPGDRWVRVDTLAEAAAAVPAHGSRVLLTTGRLDVAAFAGNEEWFLIRTITRPRPPLPCRHELLLDRGPYTVDGERRLLEGRGIDLVVTKDSGGDATAAKLAAARERGIPVVVVQRPPALDVPTAETVADSLHLLEGTVAALAHAPDRRPRVVGDPAVSAVPEPGGAA